MYLWFGGGQHPGGSYREGRRDERTCLPGLCAIGQFTCQRSPVSVLSHRDVRNPTCADRQRVTYPRASTEATETALREPRTCIRVSPPTAVCSMAA